MYFNRKIKTMITNINPMQVKIFTDGYWRTWDCPRKGPTDDIDEIATAAIGI